MAWRRRGDKLLPEPTSCAHRWGQYTPTLITTHLIQKYLIKISILQSCATQVGILQENEARNTKMYRDQETHTIRINGRYEINWANSFFSKSPGNPIFGQISDHQRAKNDARKTKMYRGQETHPIRVNARNEVNWANSFFEKVPETPFSAKYLATRGPKMRLGTWKWIGVKRLTP